jgi:hypothetical protein
MMRAWWWCALLASGAAHGAQAAAPTVAPALCSPAFITAAAASLRHGLAGSDLRDCRELPSQPGHAALVLLYPSMGKSMGRPWSWELDLAVVNAAGDILQHLQRKTGNSRDGEQLVGVKLDTARFDLASGVRALGLRTERKAAAQQIYGAGMVTTLELFVAEGTALRSVLRDLEVSASRGSGDEMDCGDVQFTVSRVLDLAKGSTRGMRDLTVRTRHVGLSKARNDQFCEGFDGKPMLKSELLRYDGKQYPVPDPDSF